MGLRSSLAATLRTAAKALSTEPGPPRVTGSTIQFSGYGSPTPIYFPDLYAAYKNSADVYRCVDVITKSVGKRGYALTKTDGRTEAAPADVRRFEDFVRGAAGTGSIQDITRRTVQAWSIAGNFYWVLTRDSLTGATPIQWDVMLPQYVTVITDVYGVPQRYFQRIPGREGVEFSADEVIHTKLSSDPEFETFGISPLDIIIRTEVTADLAAAMSNRKIFENDQIPPIMYVFEDYISAEEIAKVQQKLKDKHEGVANAHRNLYLRGVKDVKPIALTNQDAEFVKLRSLATEKTCAAYGVPKSVLGYRDTAYGGSATASIVDNRAMYELTIEPLERLFESFVNVHLLPRLGIDGMLFHFLPTSTEDIDKIHNDAREDAKDGLITLNEARRKIGLPPYEGEPMADLPLVHTPQGYVPLGQVVGQEAPLAKEAQDEVVARALEATRTA